MRVKRKKGKMLRTFNFFNPKIFGILAAFIFLTGGFAVFMQITQQNSVVMYEIKKPFVGSDGLKREYRFEAHDAAGKCKVNFGLYIDQKLGFGWQLIENPFNKTDEELDEPCSPKLLADWAKKMRDAFEGEYQGLPNFRALLDELIQRAFLP